ncbi:Glutathione S-transferase zeta-1 [Gryganskiella cystojenkinii]|nr:Glutathione S-transferase zeta-1 [Gryganskiella cystojenkinii]
MVFSQSSTELGAPANTLPILYSWYRSSCAYRVRIGLNLKKIAYEYRSINLDTEVNKTAEYKKIHPFGAVPAFVDVNTNGHVMIESVAILEYLDETRPENPLLPKNPVDRALVRGLVQAVAMDIQPVCSMRILKYIGKEEEGEWTKHWLSEGFKAFEKMLERTAGKYAFGDAITMADLVLVPQFYNGVRFGIDMTLYPVLYRVNTNLEQVQAFKDSHPTRQPDCPEDQRAMPVC